jgi:activator of 2-hydroxyglutaryl-CoA dehydratase
MIPNKDNAYLVGLDVGSTTVKGIAVDLRTDQIVWQEYQRHDTRQPEKLLEFLERMESEIGLAPGNARVFITGSGGNSLAAMIGAKHVQEVNAVALAVE